MQIKVLLLISVLIISNRSNAQIKNDSASLKPAEKKIIDTTSAITDVNVYTNILNVNPLLVILEEANIDWMHRIGAYTAIGGGLRYGFSHYGYTQKSPDMWGVLIEARLHAEPSIHGFYIAPNIGYFNWKHQSGFGTYSEGISTSMRAFTVGILLGWQWVIAQHISLGLATGVDDYFLLTDEMKKYAGDFEKSFIPALRIHVGYIW